MKSAYTALALASIAFMAFSWVFGRKVNDLSADLWGPDAAGRSRVEADRKFAAFEKDRSNLHLVIKLVSVVYYLGVVAVLVFDSRQTGSHKGRRIALLVGSVVALFMAIWSLLLSGHISFDEVFVAWLAASGVFCVLSLTRLYASFQVRVPPRVVGRQ